MSLLPYPCPACGGSAARPLYAHRGRIVRCLACGLVRRDPIPAPQALEEIYRSADYFRLLGPGAIGYADYYADEAMYRPYFRALLGDAARLRPPPGRLLEIGTAAGYALDEARAAGWTVRGLELSGQAARHARDRFGLDVVEGGIGDIEGGPSYDVILALQTLEHIPAVRAALGTLRAALVPGGLLVLTTPDHGSLVRRIARRWWPSYRPEHVVYFDRPRLRSLLEEEGFRVELARPDRPLRVPVARILERAAHYYGLPRPPERLVPRWRLPVWLGDMVVMARRP